MIRNVSIGTVIDQYFQHLHGYRWIPYKSLKEKMQGSTSISILSIHEWNPVRIHQNHQLFHSLMDLWSGAKLVQIISMDLCSIFDQDLHVLEGRVS